jgi:hypothetical protein
MAWERCEDSRWIGKVFICGCCGAKTMVRPNDDKVICAKCGKKHRLNDNDFVEHEIE